jgi:hypothetical protein
VYPNYKIDGREASLRTKQYFEEVHTTWGVLNFAIRSVEFKVAEQLWGVRCTFDRGIGGPRVNYKVTIKEDGKVESVAELEEPQR